MKVRESHMPEEELWATFFEPEKLLRTLGVDPAVHDLVEFGSGYGTFTLAAARITSGKVYAFDIEPELIEGLRTRCRTEGIDNVHAEVRDFLADGTGLSSNSIDVCLLFNILHHSDPISLMKEPFRILKPGGRLVVTHWNYDPATPRGPSMAIRPRPEQCIEWALATGFAFDEKERFDLRPYHYGLIFRKPVPGDPSDAG